MRGGLLLDTHALIRVVLNEPFDAEARSRVNDAVVARSLFVSAATAWELGMIIRKPGVATLLGRSLTDWFHDAIAVTRSMTLPLDADLMLSIAGLPEPLHRDPADRMLIATARVHDLTLVTRDQAILDYAALGHVKAIAC
ncbi:MAG: type II toxin-antitoxin system VapC family toxin [Brevundimonas sp.]|uniref:type II toxin-antitoxin system VapC family toxin n=1 Tax=Brevundimonas sp. TaxID=1871086 RepID=UPI00391A3F83